MTKKHYEAIAKTIKFYYLLESKHDQTRYVEHIAETLAGQFAGDNPKFSREMFLKACGL